MSGAELRRLVRSERGLATYLPSGENLMSRTGFLKLKWCNTVERAKLAIKALPSRSERARVSRAQSGQPQDEQRTGLPSSTEMMVFPSGLNATLAMFLRFSNESVRLLLL